MGALLRSKLVWGAIISAGSWLISQPHIQITEVITALGAVISAVGARDAIRKSAPPDAPDGQQGDQPTL
jgi:hypothetical protein